MASYIGKHAEYYDIFYQDKPYAEEAAFVHEYLRKYSTGKVHRLLELACGTGRHAFELEKLGYQIVATDYSKDLLAVANAKAVSIGSLVDFRFQDMRSLTLDDEPFDAVYCLFDSIGYVQSNEAIRKVFNGVYAHLKPDGLFLFEFWHAAAMLRGYEPKRERHWKTADGEIIRISSTKLDIPKQLAEVTYDIKETGSTGIGNLSETQLNRYFLVQEMAAFLEASHFAPLEFLPAYQKSGHIDENTWHILAIAQRQSL